MLINMNTRKVYLVQYVGRYGTISKKCYYSKEQAKNEVKGLYRQIELYKKADKANSDFYEKHKIAFTCKQNWDSFCPIENYSFEEFSKTGKMLYNYGFKEAIIVELDLIK